MPRATLLEKTVPQADRLAIWSAAVLAGVLAAVAYFVWQILATRLAFGQHTWATTRLIASLALGENVARIPLTFDPVIVATAAAVHMGLSILYACALAPLLHRVRSRTALLAGVAFGLVLYLVNLYGFAPALFPWMEEMRSWVSFLGHLLFGFVIAYTYKIAQKGKQKSLDPPESAPQR